MSAPISASNGSPAKLPSFRHLLLVLFFLGLIALELVHGTSRIETVRDNRATELIADVERRLEELAASMRPLLDNNQKHARYFARMRATHELLRDHGEEKLSEFALIASPYLLAFDEIDKIRVLDAEGREIYRCQKNGNSVASLPRLLLDTTPDKLTLQMAISAGAQGVGVSSLVRDARRVEVPASERQVLHFASMIVDAGGALAGVVKVTAYATPLLQRVRSFQLIPSGDSITSGEAYLIDADGQYLAHPERQRELGGLQEGNFFADFPQITAPSLESERILRTPDSWVISVGVSTSPPWRLIVAAPTGAIAQVAARGLWREYFWSVGTMIGVTLLLALATAFFTRLSFRELRLRENQVYLQKLARESQKVRALLEGAADMILVVDPDREMVRESNARARASMQVPANREQPGVPLAACFDAPSWPGIQQALRRAVADFGEPVAARDVTLVTRDGRQIPVDARFAAVDLEDERAVQISLRDLTQQRELERQLRISERLSSLGQLAAGMAHEINNPLEGVGNYISLLEREELHAEQRKRFLEQVKHGFDRIRDLVRDISSFARPERGESSTDVGDAVRHAIALIRFSKDLKGIDVSLHGLTDPVLVQGDGGRLEEVFLNLLINAAQAMNGHGGIVVSAMRLTGCDAGEVEITVEDDGPGIPEQLLPRIFDPFFSTKESSGLGLAISHGIIRVHGGTLTAGNRPGGGARFTIRLPLDRRQFSGDSADASPRRAP